jgi:protein TonB
MQFGMPQENDTATKEIAVTLRPSAEKSKRLIF